MMTLPLLIPWAVGAVLITLDGRRRAVGWVAVSALAANLAALAVLAATVLADGPRQTVTGG